MNDTVHPVFLVRDPPLVVGSLELQRVRGGVARRKWGGGEGREGVVTRSEGSTLFFKIAGIL